VDSLLLSEAVRISADVCTATHRGRSPVVALAVEFDDVRELRRVARALPAVGATTGVRQQVGVGDVEDGVVQVQREFLAQQGLDGAVAAAPPPPASPPAARPPAVRPVVPNTFIVSDSWSSRL
jgi:hypothetical protein